VQEAGCGVGSRHDSRAEEKNEEIEFVHGIEGYEKEAAREQAAS